MFPHGLVLLEGNLDPVRAVRVAAFAEELGLLRLESFGSLGDALVDGEEERFVPCDFLDGWLGG